MKKLSMWAKIMSERFMKGTTTNIERLTASLKDIKNQLEEIKKVSYEYKGKVKYYAEEIEKCDTKTNELKEAAKKCIEKGNDILLGRCKKEIDLLKVKKLNLEKTLEMTKKLSEQSYKQKNIAENKISDIEAKIEELKLKDSFKKEVDNFAKISGLSISSDFEEMEKEIELDFNISEVKAEDIMSQNTEFELKDEKEELEKFKKDLMGE